MKKIFLVLLLMTALFTPLSAKNLYIKVMAVSHTDVLFSVQYDLNELGYKMYVTEYENWHRVYTGPFKSQEEANKALVRIRRSISKDAFVVTLNLSEEQAISTKAEPMHTQEVKVLNTNAIVQIEEIYTPKTEETNTNSNVNTNKIESSVNKTNSDYRPAQSKSKKNLFVGFTAGVSKLSLNENNVNGDVPLNFALKDSAINYGAEGGYNFTKNIFMSINYQRTDAEDMAFNDLFSTINYKFNGLEFISPYMGIVAGYGNMTWKNSPIDATTSANSASSFLVGAQLGSEIPIYNDISMVIFYRYLMMDYKTSIKTTTGEKEITHSAEQNINLGIKYNF